MPSHHTLERNRPVSKTTGVQKKTTANSEEALSSQKKTLTETFQLVVFVGSNVEDLTSRAHSPNSSSPVFGKKTLCQGAENVKKKKRRKNGEKWSESNIGNFKSKPYQKHPFI